MVGKTAVLALVCLGVFLCACNGKSNDEGQINGFSQNELKDDDCPDDPNKTEAGTCGCGVADTDTDGDSTPDCNDDCPNDLSKTEPGVCGCGVSEIDTDNDRIADCNDSEQEITVNNRLRAIKHYDDHRSIIKVEVFYDSNVVDHGDGNIIGSVQWALDEVDQEGGNVEVGPGTFVLLTQLIVPDKTSLFGSGKDQTIFEPDADCNGHAILIEGRRSSKLNNITIAHIGMSGKNKPPEIGGRGFARIRCSYGDNINIHDIYSTGGHGAIELRDCDDFSVYNIDAYHTEEGVVSLLSDCSRGEIRNVYADSATEVIDFYNSEDVLVENIWGRGTVGELANELSEFGSDIELADTSVFPKPALPGGECIPYCGTIQIGSEQITYTGTGAPTYPNRLTGCIRGVNSTDPVNHSAGSEVWLMITSDEGIDLSTSRRITIRDFYLNGFFNGILVKTEGGATDAWNDILIENGEIYNSFYRGIYVYNSIPGGTGAQLTIRGTKIESQTIDGIGFDIRAPHGGGKNFTIENNNIKAHGKAIQTYGDYYAITILNEDPLSEVAATIGLLNATEFKNAGQIIIDNEIISYTGKNGNDLIGCVRGPTSGDNSATEHAQGTVVMQYPHAGIDNYYIQGNTAISEIDSAIWIYDGIKNLQLQDNYAAHLFWETETRSSILVRKLINPTIFNNIVESYGYGIKVQDCFSPNVQFNHILNAGRLCLYFYWSDLSYIDSINNRLDLIISNNQIVDWGEHQDYSYALSVDIDIGDTGTYNYLTLTDNSMYQEDVFQANSGGILFDIHSLNDLDYVTIENNSLSNINGDAFAKLKDASPGFFSFGPNSSDSNNVGW